MDELVAIAKIVRPRGLKGEVVAELLTDFPERFEGLRKVTAVAADGGLRELKIAEAWFQKGRLILKFDGVASIDDAEALRGAEICVAESEAVELGEGEFFDWQLADCEVVTPEGGLIGMVREVMRTGGTELLAVDTPEGRDVLIPFAESICTEVNIERKRIVADVPEGLLEF